MNGPEGIKLSETNQTNTIWSQLYVEFKNKQKQNQAYNTDRFVVGRGGKWVKGIKKYKLPVIK